MAITYALAIDIGASSGRHILGSIQNGKWVLEEVYRFENGAVNENGLLCWDREKLENHILAGMKKCKDLGKIPASVGVDTWGVDFVLVDEKGMPVSPMVMYRDERTNAVVDAIDNETLYMLTGIAKQPFNTVYQLMATPGEWFEKAHRCLFVPDYFHFFLSGVMANEYTIASTSALLTAGKAEWNEHVFALAQIPRRLFPDAPLMPGTVLGKLTSKVQEAVGYTCDVILPASHDTGSAYMAVPAKDENAVYLSSGTWSLLGIETNDTRLGDTARLAGFTHEGAYGGKVRLLRNIMGLWMLQCVRHELNDKYSFAQMADMASASAYAYTVDAGDNRFLAPDSMTEEVKAALREQGAPLPETESDLFACINRSLSLCYARAIGDLETLTGKHFTSLNIVGGGSNSRVLNQWTADATHLPVYAGPGEGTALGNIMAQFIARGEVASLADARKMIPDSFDVKTYLHQPM